MAQIPPQLSTAIDVICSQFALDHFENSKYGKNIVIEPQQKKS
jgi:hypothetical protein